MGDNYVYLQAMIVSPSRCIHSPIMTRYQSKSGKRKQTYYLLKPKRTKMYMHLAPSPLTKRFVPNGHKYVAMI